MHQDDQINYVLDEDHLRSVSQRIVNSRIERVNDSFDPADPEAFKARRQIVQTAIKDLEESLKWVKREYPEEAGVRKDWKVPKWMLDDRKISTMLDRAKMFVPLYNHLWKNYMQRKKSIELTSRVGKHVAITGKGKEEERDYVIVKPDYESIEEKLGMSQRLAQMYLKAFCKFGVLKDCRKLGRRKQKVYAIGSWAKYGEDSYRRVRFLTRKLKNELREFKL